MLRLNKKELNRRFPNLKEEISGYKQPQEIVIYNDDPEDDASELTPIEVSIFWLIEKNMRHWSPKATDEDIKGIVAPDWSKVAGFGKPAKDQWFGVPQPPSQLVALEKTHKHRHNTLLDDIYYFWDDLESDTVKYKESIDFINRQAYHFRYGYWFFSHGRPTYIDGWQFRQLCTWTQGDFITRDKITGNKVRAKLPEYRDSARRIFLFYKWCMVDTTDCHGNEYNNRTCLGPLFPKTRQIGATAASLQIIQDISQTVKGSVNSMIGNVEDTGRKTFQKKYVTAWSKQPIWLIPVHDNKTTAATKIENRRPSKLIKINNKIPTYSQIESFVDFAPKADRAYYDHQTLTGALLLDESGKTRATDILEGWELIKPATGGEEPRRFTFSMHPSTVEDMETGGGDKYFELAQNSDYWDPTPNGQTISGLRRLFLPSYDCFPGFIGKYGESLQENLNAEQKKFIKRDKGSREFLTEKIEHLAAKKSPAAKKALSLFKRKHPMCWDDCWQIKGGDTGFNMQKLSARIVHLKQHNYDREIRKGYFIWKIDGADYTASSYLRRFGKSPNLEVMRKSNVVFVDADDDDRQLFHISELPLNGQRNQKELIESDNNIADLMWRPLNSSLFTSSADSFRFLSDSEFKKSPHHAKLSLGAGTVFMNRNHKYDPEGTPPEQWKSFHFVCDYVHRPDSTREYCESMLMMSVYWGCMMFPENNLENLWEHFIDRGFGGFLKYDVDMHGVISPKPGLFTGGGGSSTKDQIFTEVRSYIEYHIAKEKHLRILQQMAAIRGKDDMGNQDLFASAGINIIGAKPTYTEFIEEEAESIDLEDFINFH